MRTPVDAVLLRVFVTEDEYFERRPLAEAVVEEAFAAGMAGATVLPAPVGYGHSTAIRSELNVDRGPHCPLVVEIVDTEAMVDRFLPVLDRMLATGLVTMERVRALHYPAAAQPVRGGEVPPGGSHGCPA